MSVPLDAALGGLTSLMTAAIMLGLAWWLSRRPDFAASLAVAFGYLEGTAVIEMRSAGIGQMAERLLRPHDAQEWLPWIALVAVIPGALAGFAKRRVLGYLTAAGLALATPVWLLWGGRYLPSQTVRESGFTTDAWSLEKAVLILGGASAALLVAWWSWQRGEASGTPRLRATLVIVTVAAASMVAGMTGSFTYALCLAALASSIVGAVIAARVLHAPGGPELIAGPTLATTGGLVLLAACYSELATGAAALLWTALVFAGVELPRTEWLTPRSRAALRVVLCLAPLAIVVATSALGFAESQRQHQEEASENPYLNL